MTVDPEWYGEAQRKSGVVTWGEAPPLLLGWGSQGKRV